VDIVNGSRFKLGSRHWIGLWTSYRLVKPVDIVHGFLFSVLIKKILWTVVVAIATEPNPACVMRNLVVFPAVSLTCRRPGLTALHCTPCLDLDKLVRLHGGHMAAATFPHLGTRSTRPPRPAMNSSGNSHLAHTPSSSRITLLASGISTNHYR